MAHIDYYFTVLSPYAYLAGTRMEDIAAKHDATVSYKPLDIGSLFGRTGGQAPKDRHPARKAYRLQEIPRQAKKANMPINLHPAHWPTNAAPASYAIIAAQNAGGGDLPALVHSVMRACWNEDKDISEDAVVKACLEGAGFDPALADSGMVSSADTYAQNLEDAVANDVFGSPYYLVDTGQGFWGQDRLDDLNMHLAGDL